MDYQTSFAISAAGMDIERLRANVAAMNLAYANTPLSPNGTGYAPLRVVANGPIQDGGFDTLVNSGLQALSQAKVAPYGAPDRKVFEPGHPQANRNGYVSYPGVDPIAEMMALMLATRVYEANVAAFNAAKTMSVKALEIGARA